jgi:tetratricopeptide (TPR) repeat protein
MIFIECAGRKVRVAHKEMNMKRTISLCRSLRGAAYLPAMLGLLAFALSPASAQQPPAPAAPTGAVHGHVTNPTGQPQTVGAVSLSTDGGATLKFTFPVDANGDYKGTATPGTYTVVYRYADTPPGKVVDTVPSVKIVVGQDIAADLDMSRQAYIDKMSPEEKKQLEELKAKNSEALSANKVINAINADLKTVDQDFKDADGARKTAIQTLGASASQADIAAKIAEIQTAKYTDAEALMTKDTAAKSDESMLFARLGHAEAGLKKQDEAVAAYKKALDLEAVSKKPKPDVQGASHAGIGEIYARQGKVPEANAEFDAAAKSDPSRAAIHLRNQAIIFFQEHNAPAQVAAADEAIKVDPSAAILYYVKGQGLVGNSTIDPKTNRIVLPPDCADAYQHYLALDPTGQFAGEVKGILEQAGQKIDSSYKAGKH